MQLLKVYRLAKMVPSKTMFHRTLRRVGRVAASDIFVRYSQSIEKRLVMFFSQFL